MRGVRHLLVIGACLVLAAGLAACGGDDGDDAAGGDGGDATTTTATDTGGATTTSGSSSGDGDGGDAGDDGGRSVRPDPSQPLQLGVGDKVSLVLDSNPTTGYRWEVTVADEAVARVASDVYLPPRSQAMGAGGTQAVEIEGVGPGETTVTAVYVRSFEPDQPAQTETWTVEVRG